MKQAYRTVGCKAKKPKIERKPYIMTTFADDNKLKEI